MIVGQRQVHHRQDLNLTIHRHRTIFDSVHTQNCALRRVDDRRRHQGTEHTTVGDGEVTTGQIFNGQLAVTAFDCQLFDFLLDVCHAEGIDITQNRRHQTARRRNRHTDVEIVVVDHIIAVDRRIHFRVTFQGFNHRFHVEGHKAQTDAVAFFKRFTVLLTQIHNRLHVDFVERGQHGGGVFRFQQTLCHTLTQASHRDTFFTTCSQSRLRRWISRCRSRLFRRGFRQMFFHIFTSQTTTHTGAFNGAGVEIVFSQQATDRRA